MKIPNHPSSSAFIPVHPRSSPFIPVHLRFDSSKFLGLHFWGTDNLLIGMVEVPAEYRWSSYGEAVGGGRKGNGKKAREGFIPACMGQNEVGFEAERWNDVSRIYRRAMGLALGRKSGRADASARKINPLFPALRSSPPAVSGASRKKQIPSSHPASKTCPNLIAIVKARRDDCQIERDVETRHRIDQKRQVDVKTTEIA